MAAFDVTPGTIAVWSDVGCPWAHVAVARLHQARRRLGIDDGEVALDHRVFSLELANCQPTPWRVLEAETAVLAGVEPDAGWQMWQGEPWEWPVTTLPALEAVQAAKAQSGPASDRLDRALRVAFFGQSRCIALRHVVLEVAGECGIDVDALAAALDDGRARAAVMEQHRSAIASGSPVKGSPHVFLADGAHVHNPGLTMHWEGEHGQGAPVVDADNPSVYDDLLKRAAAEL